MVALLHSRNFSNISEHFTRLLNKNAIPRLNKRVSISNIHNNKQPLFNMNIKKQLSTNIMKNVREEEIHKNVIYSKQPEISRITLNQPYSLFFWGKQKNFPVKCKIKCNDSGERIAEPYIAKKPNPIKLSRLTKDFTMILDHKCENLHGKKSTFKPGLEIKPHLTKMKLKSQMAPPNALTSYLKKKDECNNVFRGTDGTCDKYLHKKDHHPNAQKMNDCNQVFRGTENENDKKNLPLTEVANLTPPSKSKTNKAKQIVNNLISKLKSMKLMKSSGFISEDLINEAINRLRVKFPTNNIFPHGLTCAKETLASIKMPNCGKSLVRKFGERSKSQQFSTQQTFVEESPFNRMKGGQPSINSPVIGDQARSNFGTKFINIMNTNKGSIMKLRKTEDNKALLKRDNVPKSYKDTEPSQGLLMSGGANTKKKNFKLKKQTTYKPKSRKGLRLGKRKRRFSFSKIPIQPNVKGSVIILDETAQPLDDPCKILSVNFFKNDEIACEDVRIEDDGITEYDTAVGKFTAIKAKSNGFIKNSEVKKIPIKAKIFQEHSEAKQEIQQEQMENDLKFECNKNHFSEGEVLVNLRTKKFDNLQKKEEKYSRIHPSAEPIIRKKKISKLDKNITSFVTTVFPEEKFTKSLSKFKKNNSIQEKIGFISLNDDVKEISYSVPVTGQDDQISELKEKNMSSTSIGSDFYQKISDIPNFKSEESISRTNETIESKGQSPFANNSKNGKAGFRKGITVSPGLTRPVTQKTAHLDILKSKPFAPISNMWKNSTASTGRLTTSKKNRKKKGIKSTNNLTVLENKGHNLQQTRWKSSTSWKSKCECEEKPCPTEKRDYDEKANNLYPLPADWDYDGPAPPHLARKWATRECPPEKDIGCPITSDDMKKGPPSKRPLSAAALNRCNLDECKNRMRRRKGGYRGCKKNYRDGALNNCDCSNK